MNQEQVKEQLMALGVETVDFPLVFSGKASKKVNGLYKPATMEIVLHNKNFKSDNDLMYTAIHEYAHHVTITRGFVKKASGHPAVFWAVFHSLLEVAILRGIYRDEFAADPSLQDKARQVQDVLGAQVDAQKRLGLLLRELQLICTTKGIRYQDFLHRIARIPDSAAAAAIRLPHLDFEDFQQISPQAVELVSSIEDGLARMEAARKISAGWTLQQVRAGIKQGKVIDPFVVPATEDDDERLSRMLKERKKLIGQIEQLEVELEVMEDEIKQLQEKVPHLEFSFEPARKAAS